MKYALCLLLCWLSLPLKGQTFDESLTLLVVTGIAGADEYQPIFREWSQAWRDAGKMAKAKVFSIGENEIAENQIAENQIAENGIDENGIDENEIAENGNGDREDHYDRDRFRTILEKEVAKAAGELWIVLHGHGSFDGEIAKFNLRGKDVSSKDLSQWLESCKKPLAIVCAFSSSAPFVKDLSGPNRVILSATRSGYEFNYARFGDYLSRAISNLNADLDKDGQVSLLEAFLKASRETEAFYETAGRLASEHALIEDSGDGLGTGADWYRGVRIIKKSKSNALPDGREAHRFHLIQSEFERQLPNALRQKRDELELQVLQLRDRKEGFDDEDKYYRQLEILLLQLADVYGKAEEKIEKIEKIESTKKASPRS